MAKHLAPIDPGTSTQAAHPNRAVIRTVFQIILAAAMTWTGYVELAGLDPDLPWVALTTAVAGVITRLMANKNLDTLLSGTWLGFLTTGVDQEEYEIPTDLVEGDGFPADL